MAAEQLEPGILRNFRLFTAIMWALLTVRLVLPRVVVQRDLFTMLTWLLVAGLTIYLSWPWLQRRLGRSYLPIALIAISVGPVLANALADVVGRSANGINGVLEPARLYFWLIPPLILVSAQYQMRALVLFVGGTTLLPLLLAVGLRSQGYSIDQVGNGVARAALFLFAGLIVMRLSTAQREQRRELTNKNAELAQLANTRTQLAVSHERNRLARELHDTLAHTLSAVEMQLKATEVLLDRDPAGARAAVQRSRDLASTGLSEARRALRALRANPVEDLGLGLAIRQLAERNAERAGFTVDCTIPDQLPALRPDVEQEVYRIAEEALGNVVRHAQAHHVTIKITYTASQLSLAVSDDGIGFDVAHQPNGHYGIAGMNERAQLLGGQLHIKSHPHTGTHVTLSTPLRGMNQ